MVDHGPCNQGLGNLEPDSYTAQRLKHASPNHLHETTHRFFIGPIPEGWLNSNRKSWFKRQAQQGQTRAKTASFRAATGNAHQRALTGLDGPSAAARYGFSFPQPADVEDEGVRGASAAASIAESSQRSQRRAAGESTPPREIEPVAANEGQIPQILGITDPEDPSKPKMIPVPKGLGFRRFTSRGESQDHSMLSPGKSPPQPSFFTAKERIDTDEGLSLSRNVSIAGQESLENRPSSNLEDGPNANGISSTYPEREGSTTALIPGNSKANKSTLSIASPRSLLVRTPAPIGQSEADSTPLKRSATGVRFNIAEGVAHRQEQLKKRIGERAAASKLRRSTLQEGAIMKMERMLVRIDFTTQTVSEEYDENDSLKTETRQVEKWREYMVVIRQSKVAETDLRLQVYKSRVIPEIDNAKAKKPRHEILLNSRTTKVNLYSSLDKTVCLWYPYKKTTRILIMRPMSTAHSVEWYTFLRDALGWSRPSALQINVPDLDVILRLEKPFEGLEAARESVEDAEEDVAIAETMAAEQAVAGKMVKKCLEMLDADPEWDNVLDTWSKTEKMGLAWRRYDRLEWIHGAHEQKMYGSMAMQKSHELELRPKKHYQTHTFGKKGKKHDEPAPVEGFLVRLTSQKGIQQRFGRAFFKRMYFSTFNQFLFFNQPSKVTPPPPPRLPTITGTNIPSSSAIIDAAPKMFDINPYKLANGNISWIDNTVPAVQGFDRQAEAESQRNLENVSQCDGYVSLCRVVKVRKMRWGAAPVDDMLESGSDIDFHQDFPESGRDDGKTTTLDDKRTFELLLDNGLVMRLQAFDEETMQEWIKRLRQLVKYWKLRTASDINLLKSVRKTNLQNLNIDEDMEAVIGQFARKWEVSRAFASPQLFNMCSISCCRPISLSGPLYHKHRRRASFRACSVVLANGSLMLFSSAVRKRSGAPVPHVHQQKTSVFDLSECYLYSGLITSDDLLYSNRTFDSNNPSRRALPRVYMEDGWTSIDEDAMTCFVLWRGLSKSLFRSKEEKPGQEGQTRQKLRQVSRLGVPGRSIVFKCRSRAERDLWVVNVGMEIDRLHMKTADTVRFG